MSVITKRISSSHLTNKDKLHFLSNHFNDVKQLKNQISRHIHTKILENGFSQDLFYEMKSKDYKQFNNILTSWETQKLFSGILDFYNNQIEQRKGNIKLGIQKKIEKQYYKRNGATFKKGDLKYYQVVRKQTEITKLVNYLKYVDEDLKKYKFNLKKFKVEDNDDEKVKLRKKKQLEVFKEFNKILKRIQGNETKFRIFSNIINSIKKRTIKNLSLIEFTTGSYIKGAVFNKNSDKPVWHSHLIETENTFKYFYKFKTVNDELYLPLTHNDDYHEFYRRELKTHQKDVIDLDYDLTKEHYVSLKNNKLHIGLTTTKEKVIYIEGGKTIAGDVNFATNLLSTNEGEFFDYDRGYLKELIDELLLIDKLSKEEKESKSNKKKLEKLIRKNESYFQRRISEILREFAKNGVSDLILEDLNLSQSPASNLREQESQMKYSRLIRILRLSNIKLWFKRQGENHGIRVHLTNPAYSSQECSECHFISRANRYKQEFFCQECSHTEHADTNSPKSLLLRVTASDVLMLALHDYDEDFRLIPKKMSHKRVKQILDDHYASA